MPHAIFRTTAAALALASAALLLQPDTINAMDNKSQGFTINVANLPKAWPEFSTFGALIDFAREHYRLAGSDDAREAMRESRRKYLCELFKSQTTGEWLGFLQAFGPNSEGLGILSVTVGRDLSLTTNHTSRDDKGYETLLKPDDPIYQTASRMTPYTAIWFSGNFFPGDKDCWKVSNPTTESAMTAPDFTFKFKSLRRFDNP